MAPPTKTGDFKLLKAIHEYKKANDGNSPSYIELAHIVGLSSKSTVHLYVHRLETLGLIRIDGKQRHLAITVKGALALYKGEIE